MSKPFDKYLQEEFHRLLDSPEFLKQYQEFQAQHKELSSFTTPKELLKFLHDPTNKDYKTKDQIFSLFIKEFQNREFPGNFSLFLLGLLLPGLKQVFYRLYGKWACPPMPNLSAIGFACRR